MKKSASILNRLIALFSVIVLPIILAGLLIQLQANRSIQKNVLASSRERIADSIRELDSIFSRTNQLASAILSDSRTRRIANPDDPMSDYDRSVNVNYVRALLSNIKYSNPFVNNIRLYLPRLSIYYNSENSYDYSRKSFIGSQGNMDDDFYRQLLAFRQQPRKVHERNGQMISLQYSSVNEPMLIVETSYVVPEMEDMFSQTLLYDNCFYFFRLSSGDFTVTNLEAASALPDMPSLAEQAVSRVKLGGEDFYAFYSPFQETDGVYIQFIPARELFLNTELSVQYSIIFTVTVLLFSVVFILGAFRIIHRPIRELTEGLRQIEDNHLGVTLKAPRTSDFQYLYDRFNAMSERLRQLVEQELQYEVLLGKSRLKQLQAQINPHFLYNSFFMLNQVIARQMQTEALELSRDLGLYFRYITRNDRDEERLLDEYEHARTYADIQARRFYGRIRVEIDDLPGEYHHLPVPRLILQPLLENAFNYGLENKIRDGLLRLSFSSGPDSVSVHIEDNGEALSQEAFLTIQNTLRRMNEDSFQLETTTGIYNICRRLQLFYNRKDVMCAARSSLGGLLISITLYHGEAKDHVPTTDR